jgi:hypothetical protein
MLQKLQKFRENRLREPVRFSKLGSSEKPVSCCMNDKKAAQ